MEKEIKTLKQDMVLLKNHIKSLGARQTFFYHLLADKRNKYNNIWVEQNKNKMPFKTGDFLLYTGRYEYDKQDLYKVNHILYFSDGINLSKIILDVLVFKNFNSGYEIKKDSIILFDITDCFDTWEEALKDKNLMIFREQNYKTKILDLCFNKINETYESIEINENNRVIEIPNNCIDVKKQIEDLLLYH